MNCHGSCCHLRKSGKVPKQQNKVVVQRNSWRNSKMKHTFLPSCEWSRSSAASTQTTVFHAVSGERVMLGPLVLGHKFHGIEGHAVVARSKTNHSSQSFLCPSIRSFGCQLLTGLPAVLLSYHATASPPPGWKNTRWRANETKQS